MLSYLLDYSNMVSFELPIRDVTVSLARKDWAFLFSEGPGEVAACLAANLLLAKM